MARIPIPPPHEPLMASTVEQRANDAWYRYWESNSRGLEDVTGDVSSLPAISTATTYAQTILASTTASVARSALGLGSAALETYAAGSWTPAIAFGGTADATYATQLGRYVRIGNYVQLWASLTLTNNGSGTGAGTINGIPFTASTVSSMAFIGETFQVTAGDVSAVKIDSAATAIDLYKDNGLNVANQVDITDTASFHLSIAYRTGSS